MENMSKITNITSQDKKRKSEEDVMQRKIELIKKTLQIEYTKEEKKEFDEWQKDLPPNSHERPIQINNIEEIINFFPESSNHTGRVIELFFTKEKFNDAELQQVLETFATLGKLYEISIIRYNDDLVSVRIGDKERITPPSDGEYFGHFHPSFNFENSEQLPEPFIRGLMPSPGDIAGYFKFFNTIKDNTRIVSKFGFTAIKPLQSPWNLNAEVLEDFKKKYLDLFLGVNKLGLKTNEEVAQYFRNNFQLEIEFHEKPEKPQNIT
ncbi:MAG: hypothetical protein HYT65_00565 [Candidatus Yanofskybacteria bacterium]|nr:hypothetical protein [Candidatus Yanofskybacteria bacterium]